MKRLLLIFTSSILILASIIIPTPLSAYGGPIVNPIFLQN